ncbi:MAG: hypothetical protein EXR11_12320 [Rhodospirillaceae bacterium]|nr:hypothetical protein [Rhodospirillaceae bacterium]
MKTNVHALGMFIRFSPKESTASEFYQKKIELPLIRVVGDHVADIYWGGEASVFEIVFVKDKQPAPEPSPETAPSVPVFRVNGLEAVLARLRSRGVVVTAIKPRGPGREAFFATQMDIGWDCVKGMSTRSWRTISKRAADSAVARRSTLVANRCPKAFRKSAGWCAGLRTLRPCPNSTPMP